ncbi:ribbon-helix-helix domain-containing protein [Pseudovibrio ascidiaceicola]|jgi:predicted DNA-binding ribbon-helix-helix protein|uniref:Ribbon-helix-helix domain-containing protein n=1 Tax=Pseudovibrio ascidiaceicola TaxID=285279 RepID=A0A1I3XNA5_9HYPH|nr:ribbon-helix-helix domain-containing protein [Pseudovibrio ascidiaceicola]SFK20968.1 Ribbon-helix-helix domain-containing protein [Pseudovibrio ascidiaceicola]
MSLKKRSITLHGHRTSITLEPEFWAGLEDFARSQGKNITAAIASIDDERNPENNLSSCIRVAVLKHFQSQLVS